MKKGRLEKESKRSGILILSMLSQLFFFSPSLLFALIPSLASTSSGQLPAVSLSASGTTGTASTASTIPIAAPAGPLTLPQTQVAPSTSQTTATPSSTLLAYDRGRKDLGSPPDPKPVYKEETIIQDCNLTINGTAATTVKFGTLNYLSGEVAPRDINFYDKDGNLLLTLEYAGIGDKADADGNPGKYYIFKWNGTGTITQANSKGVQEEIASLTVSVLVNAPTTNLLEATFKPKDDI